MKGFFIDVTNNLLDAKHREAMGESVWLFMFFLDRMTSISEEGVGKVSGGKPIKFKYDILPDLGISERTYSRWVETLKKHEYINVIRTPYGLSVSVNKAKKRFGRSVTNDGSLPPKMADLNTKNGGSNKTDTIRHNSRTEDGARSTPPPQAKEFFESREMQEKVITWLEGKGINKEMAQMELGKFIGYWCEKNKSGTKERWQGEKYFDIRRRLITWFTNVDKFSGRSGFNQNKNKVVTIP